MVEEGNEESSAYLDTLSDAKYISTQVREALAATTNGAIPLHCLLLKIWANK
jgi:hypothetical protein